jgi:hypothetical protein
MKVIPGRLDLAALGKLHRPTRPPEACRACWVIWCASPTAPSIGFCWHTRTAWRIRPSGELETVAASRDEVAAMRRLIGPRT